jgi:hypothetical protein
MCLESSSSSSWPAVEEEDEQISVEACDTLEERVWRVGAWPILRLLAILVGDALQQAEADEDDVLFANFLYSRD